MFTRATISIIAALAIGSCGGSKGANTSPTGELPQSVQSTLAEVGLDPAAMDTNTEPCDDFFEYACGGWLASHDIPADKSRFGRFYEIHDRNEAELKSILDGLMASTEELSPELAKVRDFYGSCMDEASVDAYGTKPIAGLLKAANAVKSPRDVTAAIAELHRHGVFALFSLEADADFKDATKTILFVDQSGLGLPDRDYYLKDDESMKKVREAYLAHVKAMFVLAGYSDSKAKAATQAVFKIETALAKESKSRVERRDPAGMYNPVSRKALAETTPNVNWDKYFSALGYADLDGISITAPKFFSGLNTLIESTKVAEWKSYLTWQVLDASAPYLGKAFVDEAFKMTAALTGQQEIRPRWKRCLSATNGAVGELLAQPYIDRMFAGESKTAAEGMVKAISAAFEANVGKLDWMSEPTKAKTQEKRATMAYLIGYPDKWKEYQFEIAPKAYASNVLAANKWEINRVLGKVGKPYDRSEWFMVPQTVNAYYNPLANQMVFPAGILQPPFFDAKAGVAVNMGAMGMIVGHELTHGFDDSGAQFDGNGNMNNWWQKADLEQFQAKGECVVEQYSKYEPIEGVHVNGKLTLGENIADIGGVKMAFNAYKALRQGKQPIVADGFTEDQQFFLAVGQAWCAKAREEAERQQITTDPHSPPKYRVNGALTNQSDFAEAFSCKKGTPMNPQNTCDVW